MDAVFQVVYCDSKFWEDGLSLKAQDNVTFRFYILKSPAVGINDLATARQMAREVKDQYGARGQVVILAEFGFKWGPPQFREVDFDNILGIAALQDANATHCEFPDMVFTKKGKRCVLYSRGDDLGYGKFPV